MVTSTSGSVAPPAGNTCIFAGSGGSVNVSPEMNGVMMSPSKPVIPAMPMAAITASARPAKNGPMNGTQITAAVTAAAITANNAAVPAPNCSSGTLCMVIETIQFGPTCAADTVKSPVIVSESLNEIGIVTRSEEHTSELQSLRHLVCR